MRLSEVKVSLLMLMLCGATASWGAEYLYAPQPISGDAAGDGVLVREVTIKKGDTLSHLSKQFAGRGFYYPQILLFNEIKNPHRIQIGQVVRVPISRKAGQQIHSVSVQPVPRHKNQGKSVVAESLKIASEKKKLTVQPAALRGESNAYNLAFTAFNKGDCDLAIKLFDDFIKRYPASTMLPEATLNRAECYLKLSAK